LNISPLTKCVYAALIVGLVATSDGSQLERRKTFRVAALCETAKQLQSRLQNETQRFNSDFASQGLTDFFKLL